jgi:hypothetical protein
VVADEVVETTMSARSSTSNVVRAVAAIAAIGLVESELAAQSLEWRTRGDRRVDLLGTAVAYTADFDGDGRSDLLIGSPGDYYEKGRAGIYSSASGALIREWVGSVDGDSFGSCVASAGDVDGDGVCDVAIGAPFSIAPGLTFGALFVYSGRTGSQIRALTSTTAANNYYGTSLAAIGDVDGDGVPDLVSSNLNGGGIQATGAVAVISGRTGATLHTNFSPNGSYEFGKQVAAAGDVDGDGTPDYLVTSPNDPSAGGRVGAAYVYSGRTGRLIWRLASGGFDNFPHVVVASGGGDVDGDGHAEVLVGAPYFGLVDVHSGATGAILYSVRAPRHTYLFGSTVAPTGDVDGDSIPDFCVGSGEDPYSRFTNGPTVAIHSGATGAPIASFAVDHGGATSLDATQDVTGDGVPDLLVGTGLTNSTHQSANAGRAKVLALPSGATVADVLGHSFQSECGMATTIVADRDGDGYREVAVGLPGGLGSSDGLVRILSGADGHELSRISPGVGDDGFGASLIETGDVNGDGVPDLAVGAASYFGSPDHVRVYSGADNSLLRTITEPTGSTLYGWSLASGVDASGHVILAVGDPDHGGGYFSGLVEIHDLTTGAAPLTITGTSYSDMGYALACVGDVNGDGHLDFADGEPQWRTYGSGLGAVFVLSGKDGKSVWATFAKGQYDYLGTSVAAIRDLDGDGIGDVLAGSPQGGTMGGGMVTAYSGKNGKQILTIDPARNGRFGAALAALGDLNGDGVDDFAVGDPSSPDGVDDGKIYLYSGKTAALLRRIDGDPAVHGTGDHLVNVRWGADTRVDPDSIPDVVAGTGIHWTFDKDGGNAALHRLDDLFLQLEPTHAPAGATVDFVVSGGKPRKFAGLYAVALDSTPLNYYLGTGWFDANGTWTFPYTVPSGLSGHTLTVRAYGKGFQGVLNDSQDEVFTFD